MLLTLVFLFYVDMEIELSDAFPIMLSYFGPTWLIVKIIKKFNWWYKLHFSQEY